MSNDDLVDSTVMALLRFRQGGFIRLPTDMEDDDSYLHRRAAYYWWGWHTCTCVVWLSTGRW